MKPQSGAAPKGQLLLTIEELQWLTKHVERKARIAEKDLKSKRLRSTVMSLHAKIETLSVNLVEPLILPTSRIEIRILQEWCKITLAALAGPITSDYLERMPSDPEHFKKALEGTTKMVHLLTALVNKMEKAL